MIVAISVPEEREEDRGVEEGVEEEEEEETEDGLDEVLIADKTAGFVDV